MRYLTRCLNLAVLAAGAALAVVAAPPAQASAAREAGRSAVVAPNSQTFGFNNTTQYFTVPAGVHQVHLAASGGAGGAAGYRSGLFAAPGGLGAEIRLDAPVNPGDILVIEVGGQGGNATGQSAGVGANSSGTGENGGPGGNVNSSTDGTAGGGGGGGTTVVDASNPGTPLLVAGGGGGGGGGGEVAGYNGGVGGNAGTTNDPGCDPEIGPGAYGSGVTGGAGGQCGPTANGPGGVSGSGETPSSGAGTGGGGGGGYRGGNGGDSGGSGGGGGGGGGAGASFWAASTSGVSVTNGDPGNGRVVVFWSTQPMAGVPQSVSFRCCTAKSFTVPAGVTQLSISGWGGSGGNGFTTGTGLVPSRGGLGAVVSELVPVTPGDVLAVGSGGQGGTGDFVTNGNATTVPVQGGSASLNSSSQPGGDGGSITGGNANQGGTGSAGGGGTVITDQTTGILLLDAGGGGGGGGASTAGDGFNGGTGGNAGSAVVTGNPADSDGYYGSGGSTPGYTNGAGGLFASADSGSGQTAADATPGNGGGTGGGGGGGWIGGTAGQLCTGSGCKGSGGGGGAGSSIWAGTAQDVMVSNSLGGFGGATISWVAPVATTTAITSSANPVAAGTSVTFTAAVSAPGAPAGYVPTGTVTFINYATGLAYGLPASLSTSRPYTATLTTTLPAGTSQVYAYYSGDGDFVPSVSSTLTQNVIPALSASGVAPNLIADGASRSVTVTGGGFASGATLSASNTGITFSAVTVKSPTTITAKETATGSVPAGSYGLTVNQGGLTATCSGCLNIAAAPKTTSISPSSLGQGAGAVLVNLAGGGFVSPAKVTFTGPSTGVHGTVTATSETALTVKVGVASTAALGVYTVKVTSGDGGIATCSGCLTVVKGPVVTAIAPTTINPGSKTTFTATGSGFSSDLKLSGSKGVSFSGVTVNPSGTTITATIAVASTAPAGTGLGVTLRDGALGAYGSTTFNGLTIT